MHLELDGDLQNSMEENHRMGDQRPDYISLAIVGVSLVIGAIAFIRYQVDPYLIVQYFEEIMRREIFLKPPIVLLDSSIFFFLALGWCILLISGLRLAIQRTIPGFISDLNAGLFSFLFATLITYLSNDYISPRSAIAYFLLSFGLLLSINAIVNFVFKRKQQN